MTKFIEKIRAVLLRRSIRKRIWLTALLAFCLAFVSVFSTFQFSKKTIENNVIKNGLLTNQADVSAVSVYLEYLRKSIVNLYYNIAIYNIVRSDNLSFQDTVDLQNFLRSTIDVSDGTEQIHINMYNSNRSITLGRAGVASVNGCYELDLPSYTPPFHASLEPPHALHAYGTDLNVNTEKQVFTLHWDICNLTGDIVFGTLSLDMGVEPLVDLISFKDHSGYVGLMDAEGRFLYRDTRIAPSTFAQSIELSQPSGYSRLKLANFDGYVFSGKAGIPGVDLYIIELLPSEVAFSGFSSMLTVSILIPLLAFTVAFMIIMYTIQKIIKPLNQIKSFALAVEAGSLDIDIRDYTQYAQDDELGAVIKCLSIMMHKIQEMFQRQRLLSRAHRSAEAKMLLSQINPHFIYNTLQSIGTLALQSGSSDVYNSIAMLGASMHYSMDLSKEIVPLSADAAHAKYYIELQNQRFGGRITCLFDISEKANHIPVPKMILQPIVGNSFKHGKINENAFGLLEIRAFVTNDYLIISVRDNGIGMSAEACETWNQSLLSASENDISIQEHIGLLNIMYRLRLLYGNDVLMYLEPVDLGGLTVHLRLPLKDSLDSLLYTQDRDPRQGASHESTDR